MAAGTANAVELIKRTVPKIAAADNPDCPCRSALAKAIWTDRKAIDPKAIERLGPLVGKYLRTT
jgi:hypothetical protein